MDSSDLSGDRQPQPGAPLARTNAVTTVLQCAAWQRCRVHFMRNALAEVNKGHAEMVAAAIRTIFAQPTPDTGRGQVEVVADTLAGGFPPSPTCCATPKRT